MRSSTAEVSGTHTAEVLRFAVLGRSRWTPEPELTDPARISGMTEYRRNVRAVRRPAGYPSRSAAVCGASRHAADEVRQRRAEVTA